MWAVLRQPSVERGATGALAYGHSFACLRAAMPVPVSCSGSTSVLSGSDGAVLFTPPGTEACLQAADIAAGGITVFGTSDFRVGDKLKFAAEGVGATVDTALATTGATVTAVADGTVAGTTLLTVTPTPAGDSVTGAGTHINMKLKDSFAVCQVGNVDFSFTRGEIDITSLPCNLSGSGAGKLAGFRTYQAGYAEGSGSMTVRFTRDQASIANRMIQGALFTNQTGAELTIALEAVGDGTGGLDAAKSQVITFPVSLLGFSTALTPEDTPTEATITFRLSAPPTQLLGLN